MKARITVGTHRDSDGVRHEAGALVDVPDALVAHIPAKFAPVDTEADADAEAAADADAEAAAAAGVDTDTVSTPASSPALDPRAMTVSELRDALRGAHGFSVDALERAYDIEADAEDARVTALDELDDAIARLHSTATDDVEGA